MPRVSASEPAPIVFVKFTPEFQAADYTLIMGGPFELTNPLQALQAEAGAKGCVVVVNVALVPADAFRSTDDDERETDND